MSGDVQQLAATRSLSGLSLNSNHNNRHHHLYRNQHNNSTFGHSGNRRLLPYAGANSTSVDSVGGGSSLRFIDESSLDDVAEDPALSLRPSVSCQQDIVKSSTAATPEPAPADVDDKKGDDDDKTANNNFSELSCSVFKRSHPLRNAAIRLITWRWFERLSIGMIVVNCIALGLADPCDTRCQSPRCQTLQIVEHIIFAFFAIEMLIKMLAMGVWGKSAYLGDGWNCFDCFIILVGTVEYCFIEGEVNFSAIRAFRVFRPLRAINRIPGLRLLVTLLLDILPMLGNVLIFCFFIFFIFGIGGVQLWSGTLRNRCFFPRKISLPGNNANASNSSSILLTEPPDFLPSFYRTSIADFACSSTSAGMLTCDQIPIYEENYFSMCSELFDGHPQDLETCREWIKYYTDCRPDGPNPDQGTLSFDNIGLACIAIFTVISLEGWTDVMYIMQDAYSFWVWFYFVGLIMIGSLFAVNLCLVVIATQFSETKKREMARMKLERTAKSASLSRLSMSNAPSSGEEISIYNQVLNLIVHYSRLGYHHLLKLCCRREAEAPPRIIITNQFARSMVNHIQTKNAQFRSRLRYFLEHNITVGIIMGAILVNTIIMGAEHHNQPESFTKVINVFNFVFTIFFAVELVVKLYAYGFLGYITDGFNMLDLIIVVLNVAELTQGNGSNLAVLRTFRLVRVVKIIRFMPSLQRQLIVMMKTIDNIAPFFVMLSFFLYIFALLGMSLFGCRFCPPFPGVASNETNSSTSELAHKRCHMIVLPLEPDGIPVTSAAETGSAVHNDNASSHLKMISLPQPCSRSNFDSVLTSLFTVLQIFTQDAWSAVLKDGMRHTSVYASLYFVALVTIGNYVIFNLLVAILVEGFASENEAENELEIGQDGHLLDSRRGSTVALKKNNKNKKTTFSTLTELPRRLHATPIITLQNFDDPSDHGVTIFHPGVTSTMSMSDPTSDEAVFRRFFRALHRKSSRVLETIRKLFLQRADYSLFVLSRENWLRRFILIIVTNRHFDNIVLVFILANCVMIAVERPSIEPDSLERKCLDVANYVLNFIFGLEAALKILGYGFVVGARTYLRDGWNVLDFILVNCSTIHTVLNISSSLGSAETKILEIFRVLRILRALRPLRVVNRSPGLKIALETLMISIKPIGNIIIITISFFFVFAVLGLQLFRGCFHRCIIPETGPKNGSEEVLPMTTPGGHKITSHSFEVLMTIETKDQCDAQGFSWENEGFNFDNMGDALMTLFVFATFDGWVDITRNGVDCVAADRQPIQDYNPWRMIYFISFLLIVCFFMLNMFVGVVVNNFQKVQKRVHAEMEAKREVIKKEKLLARLSNKNAVRKKAKIVAMCTETVTDSAPNSPRPSLAKQTRRRLAFAVTGIRRAEDAVPFYLSYPNWRRRIYSVVVSRHFEIAINAVTVIAMLAMALEYYKMPQEMWVAVRITGYLFTGLIVLEVLIKISALGFFRYFENRWNQLDLVIVVSSITGIVIEELFVVNPTIVQLIRILRIMRVFKLLRAAQGIRRLLNTVSKALPQVGNLSLLFLLLFFIYASLGVELFGKFDCTYVKCEGLSRHANFQHFGMALLTLFRIFTGDNWNGILKDMLNFTSDTKTCMSFMVNSNSKATNETAAPPEVTEGSSMECNIVYGLSPFYFVSFVLISQFILINVVIAVLMSQLEDTHYIEKLEEDKIGDEVEQKVAVLEEVVRRVCPDLVDRLQTQMHTPREDIISLVSTEYALRQPLDGVDNNHSLQSPDLGRGHGHALHEKLSSSSRSNSVSGSSVVATAAAGRKSAFGSRSSSIVAIDQGALEEVFQDLGAEMSRDAGNNRLHPQNAIDWFVEVRKHPKLFRSATTRRPNDTAEHERQPLTRARSVPHKNVDGGSSSGLATNDNTNNRPETFRKRLMTLPSI